MPSQTASADAEAVEAEAPCAQRSPARARGTHTPPSRRRPPRCRASRSRRPRRCAHVAQRAREIADGVERRPQDGAADRAEIDPPSGLGLALEQRLVEPGGSARSRCRRNIGTRSRTTGRGRTRAIAGSEVLDLVGRIDPRRDGGQRQREQGDQQPHGPRRTGEAHSVPVLSPVTRASGTSRPARG